MPQTHNKPPQFENLLHLAQSQQDLEQWREAQKNLKLILKQKPEHLAANLALVQLYLKQNKNSKAHKILQKIINTEKPPLEALLLWARYFGQKEHEKTLLHLEKALLSHPGDSELLVQTADYLIKDKQEERALNCLKQATQKLIVSGETWLAIANLYLPLGELNLAADAFTKAIQLEPHLEHDPLWLNLESGWQDIQAAFSDSDITQITDRLRSED